MSIDNEQFLKTAKLQKLMRDPVAVLALIAENETLTKIFADAPNLPDTDVEWLEKTRALEVERDQLRAEVAGLKTGYEAYERVNGELKAEVEESASVIDQLAKILAGVSVALKGEELPLHRHGYHDLVECVTVLKLENDLRMAEGEALRHEREGKVLCDLELFETLRDSANTEADEHRQFMATYRPLRQASLDSVVKKCDDLLAALGKGEQS